MEQESGIYSLTPDAKYSIAENLSGKDLVRLCATDKSMRKICSSNRYDPIWRKRLKDDYNIDFNGTNPYMEYLHYTYFYNREYWVVTYMIHDNMGKNEIYNSLEDAINGATTWIMNYPVMGFKPAPLSIKYSLEYNGQISFPDTIVYVDRATFVTEPQYDYKEIYNKEIEELAKVMFPSSKESQDDFIFDFDNHITNVYEELGSLYIDPLINNLEKEYGNLDPKIKDMIRRLFIN